MGLFRKEFQELLENDKEFRGFVIRYLGLRDAPQRLDGVVEEQAKLKPSSGREGAGKDAGGTGETER